MSHTNDSKMEDVARKCLPDATENKDRIEKSSVDVNSDKTGLRQVTYTFKSDGVKWIRLGDPHVIEFNS